MTMLLVDCLNQRVEDLELKVERLRTALENMQAAASEVINQWRDPFDPEDQWEECVNGAMRDLGEAAQTARAALNPERETKEKTDE